jgi:hypothetical protein
MVCGLAGCISGKAVGGVDDDTTADDDGSGDASGSDDGSGTSVSSVSGDPTSASSDDAGDPACPNNPDFPCAPESCENCGDLFSGFDEDGCLRAGCDACAADEVCFRPADWGGCASSGVFCEVDPETQQCGCGGTDDCGGSYCVPSAIAPPTNCNELVDASSCLDAGCSAFENAPRVVLEQGGACSCAEAQPTCLWFAGGIGGAASPAYFFRSDFSEVARFDTAYEEPPLGWERCAGAENRPAECDCFEDFTGEC